MEFKVRFRFNRQTGEVEFFDVIDLDTGAPLPIDEHNRIHDRVTRDLGSRFEANVQFNEIVDEMPPYVDQSGERESSSKEAPSTETSDRQRGTSSE